MEHPAGGDASEQESATARIRARATAEAPLHGRLLQSARDGRWLSAIMLPFFLTIATPRGQGVLITTGRKTGKRRRKCIRVIRQGDRAYLVMLRPPALAIDRPAAVASWVYNIRADPNVHLRLGRKTFLGVAREISDAAELATARQAICETVHLIDYGECDLHLRGLPTRAKVKDLHRYWFDTGVPLVIDIMS